jgi:hypothetical protein
MSWVIYVFFTTIFHRFVVGYLTSIQEYSLVLLVRYIYNNLIKRMRWAGHVDGCERRGMQIVLLWESQGERYH